MLLHQRIDLFFRQGLVEEAGDGHLLGAGHIHGVQRGGEHDDDNGLLLRQRQLHVGFQKGQPVEHGHVHVQQNESRAGRGFGHAGLHERAQRLLAIFGHEHLLGRPHAQEQEFIKVISSRVVIDQEHTS
jgi:hypothetical protein